MPVTKYKFKEGAPSTNPGLYISCLKSERDRSVRWWDGKLWWDISYSRGRAAMPFTWPTGDAARGFKKPQHYNHPAYNVRLRKITAQSAVRWGEAYQEYNESEVLTYLVGKGVIPKDWRKCYQEEMRAQLGKPFFGSPTFSVKEYFDDLLVRQHFIHMGATTDADAYKQRRALKVFSDRIIARTHRTDGDNFLGYDNIDGKRFHVYMPAVSCLEGLQVVRHHSVWDFFKYIKYDPNTAKLAGTRITKR